jgi:lipopolysaccharide/colanic/teichoic acid biosynthesis glycosyltransferase
MFIKRVFDFTGAMIGLLILSPAYLLIGLLIRIKMPGGPVIFSQKRVGKNGEFFTMVKFCTMSVDHGGNSISVKGESRITALGRVLRKYKLDELPGLWNILAGDMSFVGPRPDVPGYADKLTGPDRRLLDIRPGLTGPATLKYADEEEILAKQNDPVRFNDEVIFPDKVRINLNYIDNWSFRLDIKIILRTLVGKKMTEPWAL